MEEALGNRQPAIAELRLQAKRLRTEASRLDELASALEAIAKQAIATSVDGSEGSLAYIGNGSGAEIALWELVQKAYRNRT